MTPAYIEGMPLLFSLQGHTAQRLGIWIFGRCFRYFRSLSFCNLRFGRCRLSYVLFGGLFLLLYLRRLSNLFYFIFVSHSTHSLLSLATKNKRHLEISLKFGSQSIRCLTQH